MLTGPHVIDALSHGIDYTASFVAVLGRKLRLLQGITSRPEQYLGPVQPDRLDLEPHLAGARYGHGLLDNAHDAGIAVFVETHYLGHRGNPLRFAVV